MAARAPPRVVLVETTLPATTDSERIIQEVLEERKAACANWWPVHSAYWWNGSIEHTEEWHVSFKTTQKGGPALLAALRARHPYEVPYLAVLPASRVEPSYARWMAGEAGSSGRGSTSKRKSSRR